MAGHAESREAFKWVLKGYACAPVRKSQGEKGTDDIEMKIAVLKSSRASTQQNASPPAKSPSGSLW